MFTRPFSLARSWSLSARYYLRLQLSQVSHHLSTVRHQIFEVILQTLQLLACLSLLAAPLPEVGHAASLELRIQLHIQGPLMEDPLHLHLTVSRELQEKAGSDRHTSKKHKTRSRQNVQEVAK